jgi:hypothetical protein
MRFGVADSALKHGIPYRDVVIVAEHGDYLGTDVDGLSWWCGSSQDSGDIEVAGFSTDDGAIILVHAMPMRWRKR